MLYFNGNVTKLTYSESIKHYISYQTIEHAFVKLKIMECKGWAVVYLSNKKVTIRFIHLGMQKQTGIKYLNTYTPTVSKFLEANTKSIINYTYKTTFLPIYKRINPTEKLMNLQRLKQIKTKNTVNNLSIYRSNHNPYVKYSYNQALTEPDSNFSYSHIKVPLPKLN